MFFVELFNTHTTFYLAELFHCARLYFSELFFHTIFCLDEVFRHATFYLAELFRQIAFPQTLKKDVGLVAQYIN